MSQRSSFAVLALALALAGCKASSSTKDAGANNEPDPGSDAQTAQDGSTPRPDGGHCSGSDCTPAGDGGPGAHDSGTLAQDDGRTLAKLDADWRFHKGDADGADATDFDDASWDAVSLPHTWNAQDGQDGPNTTYYRGVGWYRLHAQVPAELAGRRLYLQFDGSNLITDVFVNGEVAGNHRGGYARFRFDVTDLLKPGQDNLIAVKVDNSAGADANHQLIDGSSTVNIAPLSADYTFFGGLYRNVWLLATDTASIDPTDYASSGIYIKQTNVGADSAELALTYKLLSTDDAARNLHVHASVRDADDKEVQAENTDLTLAGHDKTEGVLNFTLDHPHLWNGRTDPYLYRVRVELLEGDTVIDAVTEPLGLRFFTLDADQGFSLNGQHLDLHGVNKHQDHKDKGWAISDDDTDADFAMIMELGATAVRLAHYQHAQHTYDVTDKLGLVTWAETPVVNRINDTPEFADNAAEQLTELIRQNYNHPSIVFWSVGNETLLRTGPSPDALIAHLADVAATEDPTRIASYAANGGSESSPVDWHGAAHGFNEYQGWYGGKVADFAGWADNLHAGHAGAPIGITEYGAGASITLHEANAQSKDTGGDHTPGNHTEEYQSYFHEGFWKAMSTRPFLWGKLVWNGFDFASDGRTEGATPGLNDKGLITFDRQTKKDAFFWYKANWSSDPFVYITSRRFTDLAKSSTSIKVYSNQPTVELVLNGQSLGERSASDHVFTWTGVSWKSGDNVVEAHAGASSDSVTWTH